ncbi:hypothetical protein LINPERPRIM_LOCUS6046 [Linum perenne]
MVFCIFSVINARLAERLCSLLIYLFVSATGSRI